MGTTAEQHNDTRFWHPFADMAAVRSAELVIDRGEGVWVWAEDGTRYLDATAALWYANAGHGRPEITAAVSAQMGKIAAYSTFGDLSNRPAIELCERLATLAPMEDPRIFLASGGSDGIETAAKLARRYWHELGEPQRTHIIARTNAYHGVHGYGTALGGIEANRGGWGGLDGDVTTVPYDSAEALEAVAARIGPERIAAVFMEPVIGAGGVYPPPEGYVEAVANWCRETGVLLIADSVICAFGRLGTWFGIERWDVSPDMIVFAKGVTSGYLPLGGVVVSGRVAEPFWSERGTVLRHGCTYAGHPTVCAAALANLEILEREGLIARGRELEGELHGALAPLAEHPLVAEVRGGTGLLAAVELDAEARTARPALPAELAAAVRKQGVLVRALGAGVAASPPLVVTPDEIAQIAAAIEAGLSEL